MTDLAPLSEKTLALAHQCPRCEAPAVPAVEIQSCVRCAKPFLLIAGARRTNPSSPELAGKSVKVTYGEGVIRYMAIVDEAGVGCSPLDPIAGVLPLNRRTIAYGDVASIGLYRRTDWVMLIALILLFLLPVVVPLAIASFAIPGLLLLSVPCAALFGLGIKKSVGIGVQRMRVTSVRELEPPLTLRFDSPMWKRKRFLQLLLTRSGVGAVAWK